MTFRVAFPALVVAAALALAFGEGSAKAAAPSVGTLGTSSTSAAWAGQLFTVGLVANPALCAPALDPLNALCDHETINVASPGTVDVGISWSSADNDFDLYVFDSAGTLVASSNAGDGTSERVAFGATPGRYEVRVVPFFALASDYRGSSAFSLSGARKGTEREAAKREMEGSGDVLVPSGTAVASRAPARISVDLRGPAGPSTGIKGKVRYRDAVHNFHSTVIDLGNFEDATRSVFVQGQGRDNGSPVTFQLQAEDRADRSYDTWELTIEGTTVPGPGPGTGDFEYDKDG